MTIFITSDLHLGHTAIMKYCPNTRGRFDGNVITMNESIVQEWNAVVKPDDLVYILGDVAFLPAPQAAEYLRRMHGKKILIEGNHDRKLLQKQVFLECFEQVHFYLEIEYQEENIVMCHYPIARWNRMHHGAIHFHGHCHGAKSGLESYRIMDVGFDATGQVVMPIDEAIAQTVSKEIIFHH